MAIHFHSNEVAAEELERGVRRQRLIDGSRVADTRVLFDRITLDRGASLPLVVESDSLVWFQLLEGKGHVTSSVSLNGGGDKELITERHSAFLPQGFRGSLSSENGATLILATVPNASKYDPALTNATPPARIIDWTREPVLASEHDARSRIYLASPGLFGTEAMKGEMILYPPGTNGANHHHVGADHFMFFLKGRGTAWANEEPFRVEKDDVVYYPDLERHYLKADADSEMAFVEFFIPGVFKTIWVDPNLACTWNPTGRDFSGGKPVREISRHGGSTPSADV